jgi:hypothetical protein
MVNAQKMTLYRVGSLQAGEDTQKSGRKANSGECEGTARGKSQITSAQIEHYFKKGSEDEKMHEEEPLTGLPQ